MQSIYGKVTTSPIQRNSAPHRNGSIRGSSGRTARLCAVCTIAGVLFSVSASSRADIIYKIVDSAGRVTFSERPPSTAVNAVVTKINKQTGQWGLTYPGPSSDIGRVKMTMSVPPQPVEQLKYTITDKGNGAGELQLAWERHIGTIALHAK